MASLATALACTILALTACGDGSQSSAGPAASAIQPIKVKPAQGQDQGQRFASLLGPLSRSGAAPSGGQLAAPGGGPTLVQACAAVGAASDVAGGTLTATSVEPCLKALVAELARLGAANAVEVIPVAEPAAGTVTASADGLITYAAGQPFPGEDEFELIVTDGEGRAVRLRLRVVIGDPDGSN